MCRRPTIAASPTAGHTGPALQAFYQLRTPCQNSVIANRCAHRCGNPYSLRVVRCRKGNTDSHVAPLLGMTFYENAVSIGGGAEPPPPICFSYEKEVAFRPPPYNMSLHSQSSAYSSSCPTRAICSSSGCFCAPHKMTGHFAGSPRMILLLGGSEFRLRQGFAAQNAWCGAEAAQVRRKVR